MQMRTLNIGKIWVSALLIALLVIAGCGDPDKNGANIASPIAPLAPPTVTNVTPPNGSTLVCPNTALITATFSKPMNPATITTSSFTVASSAGSVAGSVAYNAATQIATFTPSATLAVSTQFTATITTGAQDNFGNPLATNFVWKFT